MFTTADHEPGEPDAQLGVAWSFPVVAEVAVHKGPIGDVVASPDGGRLMVTNYGADSVSVIDARTRTVVKTVNGTREPFAIAVGASRAYVGCAAADCDAVAVIDTNTNTVISAYPSGRSISDLAVSPDGKRVYAARTGVAGADVAVMDTTRGRVGVIDIATAPGTTAGCVRISSDGQRLYVATHGASGGKLAVIDTGTHRVIDAIEIGSAIRDVVLSADGATAYVGSHDPGVGGLIDVIDTRTSAITNTVAVGGVLTQVVLSHDGDRMYVLSENAVTVLCTWTHDVLGTVAFAHRPSCMVESQDGSHLYVADCAGTVTAIAIVSITAALVAEAVSDAMLSTPELWQAELAMA